MIRCNKMIRSKSPSYIKNIEQLSRWNNIQRCSKTTSHLKTLDEMPGLSKLPVIGSLHHFLPVVGSIGLVKNFFLLSEFLHKKYGSMVKMDGFLANRTMVWMYEPEDYNQVYRAEEDQALRPGFDSLVYYRTELRKEIYDGVYGLTTAQGAQWRDFRTKVNPALLKLKLIRVYKPAMDEIAIQVVERINKIKDDTNYLQNNFDLEMTKFSLESIGYVGLGARLGCFRDDLTGDHPARQLITCAKDILELAFKLEAGPSLWKHISTPSYRKLVRTFDTQWDISSIYIEQAKNLIKNRTHDIPEEDKSIIERLLAIDEKVAVMMANEMLMAGIDTVAFTLIGLLYRLARNPDKQENLRKEIRSGSPNKRYLKACLKESLRLWPVVPANLRRTSKEHVVAGYLIPKGVDVIAPNEYLSKLEKYYPKPLEFIPERWLAEKSDPLYYGNAHPMVTLPFGFGVRTCIGRRIAELEIETLVERIIEEFRVTWQGPPIKIVSKITNLFEKPYNFKFESAK